ncbi:TM2 domain-containing protein [Chloracidobacterium validum]|uniref:TM2 domain-containing protein n=1 Tax=Chloracidobacterium validum TaxID=2821543 RepID=A0ABX8BAK1_9BACT|nr:TM2 domain-containing protein [Chloracidobacterium validum]
MLTGSRTAFDLNVFSSPYGGQTPPSYQPAPYPPSAGGPVPGADKKIPAAICAILLGALGVHKFILGYTTEGLIMLGITILTCGFGAMISSVIGLVEGIMYLTKSDQEFVATYVQGRRGWF